MELPHGFIAILLCCLQLVLGGELTFELPDNARQCFHENINKDTESTFEYQVITGGQYDVDLEITAPNKQVLYKEVKKQYDSFTWTAQMTGIYQFCFSNEFSTFSHKVVYFDLQVGDEKPLFEDPSGSKEHKAMTMMESTSEDIHESMNDIGDLQTFFKHREAQGRAFAESLNGQVLLWSICQSVVLLFVGIGQVVVLKSFFSEKKPARPEFGFQRLPTNDM